MQLNSLVDILPKPSVIGVLGRRGSGKDVTAHEIARQLHIKNSIPIYIDADPKKYYLPSYFKEAKEEFANNSIYLISDAHLSLYARSWSTDYNQTIDKLITISRHKNINFIFTTQESARLDRNVIMAVDALIFKEPSLLAAEFERPEMRELTREAAEVFDGKGQQEKWSIAYAVTPSGNYVITGLKLPYYWSDELSKRYGDAEWSTTEKKQSTILRIKT